MKTLALCTALLATQAQAETVRFCVVYLRDGKVAECYAKYTDCANSTLPRGGKKMGCFALPG